MTKKTLRVLLLVGGLLAYGAYSFSILRPYFARVELETAWELDYGTTQISKLHIGDGDTIFLTTENSGFIAVSPGGHELYRYEPLNSGYSYGYDDGSNDTLWVSTMDFVDTSQLPQASYNQAPAPIAPRPSKAGGETAKPTAAFVARLVSLTTSGETIIDQTFEVGGFVNNLWCTGGKIYFIDSGQNMSCYDEQGNQLWVKEFPAMVDFSKSEGELLFLDCGSEVVGINLDGDELWRTTVGQGYGLRDWRNWSTAEDRLCLLDNNDYVHVIGYDGQHLWSVQLSYSTNLYGGRGYAEPSAKIHADSTVYTLSRDATLSKYSPNGNKLWNFRAGSNVKGLELGPDGTVYLQNENKGLMAISARGNLLWRDVRFGKSDIQPRVGATGMLYIVQGNKLKALRIPGN